MTDVMADTPLRDAIHSSAAVMARCLLAPVSSCQEDALRCGSSSESGSKSERQHGTHPLPTDFSAQLPFLLHMLAAFPPEAHVCVAAAAGLDGEASVLVAARLAVLRGTSALEALISVSHTRLALHLQERHVSALASWAEQALPHQQQQQQQ